MRFTKTKPVKTPNKGTEGSAGIDFFVPDTIEESPSNRIVIMPNDHKLIPSGIKVEVPKGYALVFFNKSGVATRKGLQVGACVVDEDYRGEVHIHVFNFSKTPTVIHGGEKLIQGLLLPVPDIQLKQITPAEFEKLENTQRGEGGFGSTGTR